MKNKESYERMKSTKTYKSKTSRASNKEKRYSNDKQFTIDRSVSKETPIYSKTQIDRLKHFYYTTRWLPNTSFTTYFGKPAFENYGYGNINPVNGGLFYGNYMLSHNINPIDGGNLPDTKQVYSSAMLKAIRRNDIRNPEPPRKVPEEIRNSPEELEEIKTRNPIFQLPNQYPGREICKPDLLKSRYFRSGKNTPKKVSYDKNDIEEYEVFNIDDVLNNKKLKTKKKNVSKYADTKFNPFEHGKIKLPKKKIKEDLNYKEGNKNNTESSDELNQENEKKINDYDLKHFYERMLKEENINENNLTPKDVQQQIKCAEPEKCLLKENKVDECFLSHKDINTTGSRIKKKENPCLLAPSEIKHPFLCCVHDCENKLQMQDMNPQNYKDKPACALNKILPAGKPVKKSIRIAELFK